MQVMRQTGGSRARETIFWRTQAMLFLLPWRQRPGTLRHATLGEDIGLRICVLDRRDASGSLGRVPSVLSLACRLTDSPTTVVVFVALTIRLASVDDTVHALVAFVSEIVIHAEARAAARTATLTLIVSRKRIATCEPAATFVARVRTLAGVEFRMTFQIMQTTETRLARGTFIRLFLTVR